MNSSEFKLLVAEDTNEKKKKIYISSFPAIIVVVMHAMVCSYVYLHTIACHLSFHKNNFIQESSFSPDLKDNFIGFIGMVNDSKNLKRLNTPLVISRHARKSLMAIRNVSKVIFTARGM